MSTTRSKPAQGIRSERLRDLAFCGIIVVIVIAYFADAIFTGKNFLSEGDNVAFYSFIPYLEQGNESGEFPLWTPYIFAGMPSLASFLAAADRWWDILGKAVLALPRFFGDVTGNDTTRLALWYAIYGCGIFTLMRVKKHERLIALFSSVSAVFSTFVIVWIVIGHSTKPVSLATFPWILLALERIRERFTLLNLFILILPLVTLVSATHPQMMFYFGCGTILYFLVELTSRAITKSNPGSVVKAGAAIAGAAVIAIATHADMFMATRDYTPYSTRGSAPMLQTAKAQDATGGNDYEYATNWSFSPGEMMTFLVPNYYGFGKLKIDDPRGGSGEETVSLYWGQMPFTDAANYMGIGVLLLGCIGLWTYRRDPFVQFLGILGLFSLLLSFGKNGGLLYNVFFELVPSFNKFRAPSMALVLLQFAMPVLAGYGLSSVLGWARTASPVTKRNGLLVAGSTAAFLLLGVAWTNISEKGYKDDIVNELLSERKITSASSVSPAYTDIIYNEMKSDWMATGVIAVLFGGLVLLVVRGTVKPSVALPIFVGLTLLDLWRVDKRNYEPVAGSPERNVFATTDVVTRLKQETAPFRVCDLTRQPANWWAYHFIESVHGYSSAKLRVYQDMLDIAGRGPLREGENPADRAGNSSITNPLMWDLLNVKYIIAEQQLPPTFPLVMQSASNGSFVYENTGNLGRVWFVDELRVAQPQAILEAMRDATFNPSTTAFVEKAVTVRPVKDSTRSVRMTAKSNQHIAFSATVSQPSFLVVSEVFYPEWHAYVDGREVDTHKTNFLLRGIELAPGTHTVEFRYISPGFETGRTVSIAANGLALLIGALGMFLMYRERGQGAEGASV